MNEMQQLELMIEILKVIDLGYSVVLDNKNEYVRVKVVKYTADKKYTSFFMITQLHVAMGERMRHAVREIEAARMVDAGLFNSEKNDDLSEKVFRYLEEGGTCYEE